MTLANAETGELTAVDRDASSVVEFLEKSKWALDVAVEMTGPAEVAQIKAQVVMAETYARELALSKDIRDQAVEMVRRAEWSVTQSIKRARERGELATQGQNGGARGTYTRVRNGVEEVVQAPSGDSGKKLPSVEDIVPNYYTNGGEMVALEGADRTTFEAALDNAKAEGNVSRANVVRKIRGQNETPSLTRQQRADLIANLAAEGYSSRQMPSKVGVTEETVRQIARDFDIEIPADKVVGRSRRIDWTDAVAQTVTSLENSIEFIESQIDLNQVDFAEADKWLSSLTNSIRALNRFKQKIKEHSHV